MHVLVCGGAGYIGSHMCLELLTQGHQVTILDNLSTGHAEAALGLPLIKADIRSDDLVAELAKLKLDAVMHFSALSLVGVSMKEPAEYWENNLFGTWRLLEAMRELGIQRFIFSSTAATYGNPETDRIAESHPTRPINPYGHTKLAVESLLKDYASAYGLQSASLRYFNAAGADPSGRIGEAHNPETHLIPNVLKSMASGDAPGLKVFGNDYDTPDGTCVRDYIHVNDLATAHLKALQYLDNEPGAEVFNLGNGNGFSVLEVIKAAEQVVGTEIPYDIQGRRAGDPAVLVADSGKAQKVLGWTPQWTDLSAIVDSAWRWHKNPAFG